MNHAVDSIIAFIHSCGFKTEDITGDTSIGDILGLLGDDLDEFLAKYSQKFSVDMSGYLWYFHSKEEGWNAGALFIKPPNKRVVYIPITVDMLKEFADKGSWLLKYPDHKLPRHRLDIVINRIFSGVIIAVIVGSIIRSCTGK